MSDPIIVLYALTALFFSGVVGWISGEYFKNDRTISFRFAASISVVVVVLILPTVMTIVAAGRFPGPASLFAVPVVMIGLLFLKPIWLVALILLQVSVAMFPCALAYSMASKHRLREVKEQKQWLEEVQKRFHQLQEQERRE